MFVYNKQKEIKMRRAERWRDSETHLQSRSRGEIQKLEEKFANTPRANEQEFDWRTCHETGGKVEGEMKEKGG